MFTMASGCADAWKPCFLAIRVSGLPAQPLQRYGGGALAREPPHSDICTGRLHFWVDSFPPETLMAEVRYVVALIAEHAMSIFPELATALGYCELKLKHGSNKMAQWVKELAAKPEELSSIRRISTVEEKGNCLKISSVYHMCALTCALMHTHTITNAIKPAPKTEHCRIKKIIIIISGTQDHIA